MQIKGQGTIRFVVWIISIVILWRFIQPFDNGLIGLLPEGHHDIFDIFIGKSFYIELFKLFIVWQVATVISNMIHLVPEWERVAVFRLGRFERLAGPGLFLIPPFFWATKTLDMRVVTIPIEASQTLTKDDVTVDVNGVAFIRIDPHRPELTITQVKNHRKAATEAAQAALKDAIGSHTLHELMTRRDNIGNALQESIDEQTTDWGVQTDSILIKDVIIPTGLQDAMSRTAQADREAQARKRLAEAEVDAAGLTVEAAQLYASTPGSLRLRLAGMAYEAMSQGHNHLIVVPSEMMSSMSPGELLGLASRFGQEGSDGSTSEPGHPGGFPEETESSATA